ncbi:MAG: hypothetical protein HY763_04865 [Planctomycetes bacterium]|nr:hypothetical protein [Planctomycetota bacterium]
MVTTFLYALGGGMFAVLATGRPEQIAWRFLRLCGYLVLALATGSTVWIMRQRYVGAWDEALAQLICGGGLAAAAIGLALLGPLASRLATATRTVCALGGLAGLAAASVGAARDFGGENVGTALAALLVAGELLAGWVLGSITVAWLLGHAYLTATHMTSAPLRHFARVLTWAVAARVAFAVASVALAAWITRDRSPSVPAQLTSEWLIVSVRAGLGLAAPALFAYMVSDCVRRRATQSATGILYFGSIFAYMGELAAAHLTVQCRWPW